MAQRIPRIAGPALAAALMFFLARPAAAAGPFRCCLDWLCGPPASLPVGSPTYGYNTTIWEPWTPAAGCAVGQPVTLTPPISDGPWSAALPIRPDKLVGATPTITDQAGPPDPRPAASPYDPVRR